MDASTECEGCKTCDELHLKVADISKKLSIREATLQVIHSLIRVKKRLGTFSRLETDSFLSNLNSWHLLTHSSTNKTLDDPNSNEIIFEDKKIEWTDFFNSCSDHVHRSIDILDHEPMLKQSMFISMFLKHIGISLDDFELEDNCSVILSQHVREIEMENYYLKRLVIELDNASTLQTDTIESMYQRKRFAFPFMTFGTKGQLRWYLDHPSDMQALSLPSRPFSALELPINLHPPKDNKKSLWGTPSIESIDLC